MFDLGDNGIKKAPMTNLNPITSGYLKLLEFVSVILIAVGEKLDPLFTHQRFSSAHLPHLRPQESWWSHNNQCSEFPNPPSSSDIEPMGPITPDYYFDRYDARSPFYDHFSDSDVWDNTSTGPDNHHGPDPFDSY